MNGDTYICKIYDTMDFENLFRNSLGGGTANIERFVVRNAYHGTIHSSRTSTACSSVSYRLSEQASTPIRHGSRKTIPYSNPTFYRILRVYGRYIVVLIVVVAERSIAAAVLLALLIVYLGVMYQVMCVYIPLVYYYYYAVGYNNITCMCHLGVTHTQHPPPILLLLYSYF